MPEVTATWIDAQRFAVSGTGGHTIVTDVPGEQGGRGFKPSELLLAALATCTGVDVIGILRKQRQRVTGLRINLHGEQEPAPPWPFVRIEVEYVVVGHGVDPAAVERAIKLSEERYCSVAATIRERAEIHSRFRVEEDSR